MKEKKENNQKQQPHQPTAAEEAMKSIESTEALQEELSRTQKFFDENKSLVTGVLGGICVLVVAYFGYNMYIEKQDQAAQAELSSAVFYMEKDSLQTALEGDGNYTSGLLAVADDFSSTPAGNLAHFYAGLSYLKLGEFDNAIAQLEKFSSSDLLVQARAYALIGDAYSEKQAYGDAISFYKKAADYKGNDEFTPVYLQKLAFAQEANSDKDAAAATYNTLIEEYPNSAESRDAKKYLAGLGL
ncbi:tetratricopeptide repeat protein [Sediminitomix flava]|uniref:Tetratricopeptide repeat protein n=1 Tax=Sediminitomix flava TaxID=379075 RepID=A0A315Z7J3_SEDFL|nr:tetratricopeptide repeat protein [Sediminitomix flava]PWJ40891.1 tetratricopeptide repeat protein [Sediminitomix flava]